MYKTSRKKKVKKSKILKSSPNQETYKNVLHFCYNPFSLVQVKVENQTKTKNNNELILKIIIINHEITIAGSLRALTQKCTEEKKPLNKHTIFKHPTKPNICNSYENQVKVYFITDKIQENQRVRIGYNKFKETESKFESDDK